MERDFLGPGSKLSPITVKEETSDSSRDSAHPSIGMMERSLSSKVGCAPQFVAFGADMRRNSVNDHLLSSATRTPTSTFDQNRRTHYTSLQEVRMFPISSHTTEHGHFRPGGKGFINSSRGSPFIAPPVSLFPLPNSTDIRCSSKPPPPAQLTIFYAGSVSVYQDISPDKAQAIMLLAGNGPQTPIPKAPTFLPSTSYIFSDRLGPTTKTTDATNIAPPVGLPQSRKASLARFLEKRKDRVINVSPYYIDNKSSTDCTTPMSECASSSLSSSSAVRPI